MYVCRAYTSISLDIWVKKRSDIVRSWYNCPVEMIDDASLVV